MTVHAPGASPPREPALLCFSHLRWNFVYQRPQHLMVRLAKSYRVMFFEEPVVAEDGVQRLEVREVAPRVRVFVPHLSDADLNDSLRAAAAQRYLLNDVIAREHAEDGLLWFYTPMALAFAGHLLSQPWIYDCMDELSAFAGAPAEMSSREARLLARADLVFTGGRSLYLAKRELHPNVHCVPSSVDAAHFRKARMPQEEPTDQLAIPGPRIGFAGVIDERMDLSLVRRVARLRPDWQLIMLGPVVKIDPATLPRLPNIHYLGLKPYQELPAYLSGWNVAMLPFAHNAATRFISPTKTPEYLAAGLPVVSTSIPDVLANYGAEGLALIADTAPVFVAAVEAALKLNLPAFWRRADQALERGSWDQTVEHIESLIGRLGSRSIGAHVRFPPAVAAH
jgi:glycosyltransferase involved in cell wall biosynthesis